MKRGLAALMVFAAAAAWSEDGGSAAAPTFQELMRPELFPEAQRGLEVESVQRGDGGITVRTTGAVVRILPAEGKVVFEQRILRERVLAELGLQQAFHDVRITHDGAGFARITTAEPPLTIRVNGDSLFMLQAHVPLEARIGRGIAPAWHASHQTNHLLADEWGAFGLYCSETGLEDRFDPYAEEVARYPLPADAVLWVAVCPPRPYDWARSLEEHVVWHWSRETGYPDDGTLRLFSEYGGVVLLQSEVMLWKDWNLGFEPRHGGEAFSRVRNTLHELGARFIVYTSPYYFLRGTALEARAMNSFEGFTGWPPGTPTGENMGLFLDAIRKVMGDHRPDGLYFDGQYTDNPAALYALARSAREIVGEDGILEWHSTHALGRDQCYLPPADAYVDYILRGEGREERYQDRDYLRFFVSGYGINNCIGVVCNNGPAGITEELARNALDVNARFHTLAGWLHNPDTLRVVEQDYRTHLTPALKARVHQALEEHQRQVSGRVEAARQERAALTVPLDSTALSDYEVGLGAGDLIPHFSPANAEGPLVGEGDIRVRAHAHTYSYIEKPLEKNINVLECGINLDTDKGMSWGPAFALKWPDGVCMRVGVRSDGLFQTDILGDQRCGGQYAGGWVWLRARWRETLGVVEYSADGEDYRRLWMFEHGGAFNRAPAALLLGKVPYNCLPGDHSEAGPLGECAMFPAGLYCLPR